VDTAIERLALGEQELEDALLEMINEAALLGTNIGRSQIEAIYGVDKQLDDIDWGSLGGEAVAWVTQHVKRLMAELRQTSRDSLQKAITQWTGTGLGVSVLLETLERMGWGFDRKRAKLIAQTETTNAFSKGVVMAWAASQVVIGKEWRTANDEAVCPICAPLGGMRFSTEGPEATSQADQSRRAEQVGLGQEFTHPGGQWAAGGFAGQRFMRPPAHPNCRCWLVPVVAMR
jgi:uncharacterized protein with gpF-like domain